MQPRGSRAYPQLECLHATCTQPAQVSAESSLRFHHHHQGALDALGADAAVPEALCEQHGKRQQESVSNEAQRHEAAAPAHMYKAQLPWPVDIELKGCRLGWLPRQVTAQISQRGVLCLRLPIPHSHLQTMYAKCTHHTQYGCSISC